MGIDSQVTEEEKESDNSTNNFDAADHFDKVFQEVGGNLPKNLTQQKRTSSFGASSYVWLQNKQRTSFTGLTKAQKDRGLTNRLSQSFVSLNKAEDPAVARLSQSFRSNNPTSNRLNQSYKSIKSKNSATNL